MLLPASVGEVHTTDIDAVFALDIGLQRLHEVVVRGVAGPSRFEDLVAPMRDTSPGAGPSPCGSTVMALFPDSACYGLYLTVAHPSAGMAN